MHDRRRCAGVVASALVLLAFAAGCVQTRPVLGLQDEVDTAAEALLSALSALSEGAVLDASSELSDLARLLGLGEMTDDDRALPGGPATLIGADGQDIEIIAGVVVDERTWFGPNSQAYFACLRLHSDGSGDHVVYEQSDCPEDARFSGPVVTAAEADLEMSWPR